MIDYKHYTYRVTWSPDDQEFIALCVEFPSLSFLAENHDKALKGIVKTVGEIVADLKTNGEHLPVPFADRKYSGKFQVRIPPELHRHLVIEAAEQDVSLNRHISAKLNG